MNKFAIAALTAFSLTAFGSSCELIINQEAFVKQHLGVMSVSQSSTNSMWLDQSSGDKTQVLNTNDLFEFNDSYGSRYVRLNGKAFNHTGTGQTFIYDLAYGFNVSIPPGSYNVISYKNNSKPMFGRNLTTVGDSITWWQHGRKLRCLMRDNGLMFDFSGSQTDIYGFGHDGAGGNTTQNILDRMQSIPVSDAYYVLAGTNDRITPQETFDNLVEISQQLKSKNQCARIYIATLLPRVGEFNQRNQQINALIKSYQGWCAGCSVIDIGGYLYTQTNWVSLMMPDGLHPTEQGYNVIASYLAPRLL